ncbi:DUF441 family protein [Sneathia sanguinegens]|uniref:DUF441 family protein n=1 Tax=Sneathia sanguinegens TaxID=40543 RepID=A0ABT7HJ28_9FUSO|nr:DUF441 family protein [Sneathia sanguinegens]MDK9580172.1 DUF441 family protein [Sneathia sanguinegens]
MDKYIILGLMCVVGYFSKNKGLLYASIIVLLLSFLPFQDKTLGFLKSKGLKFGVLILTIAILSPIALGQISIKNLIETFTSYQGLIAVIIGIIASLLSKQGIQFQSISPNVVIAGSIGIIIGIVSLGGTAVGPIIASGMTFVIIKLIENFIR